MASTKQDSRHHVPEKKSARPLCSLALPLILLMAGSAPSAHAEAGPTTESDGSEAGAGPVFSSTGPDATTYGAAAGFPVATRATASQLENLVGTYSHFDELVWSRLVR